MGVAAPRNSPYGNYLAGLVAGQQRDLSAAANFMLAALESDPDNLPLLRRTFSLVASDGRHQKAVELARRVLAKDPGDGMAGLVLAVDVLQADQIPSAATIVDGLPDRSLSAISKPMLKAWLLVAQEQHEAALTTLAKLDETKGFEVVSALQAALLNDVAGHIEAASADYGKALEKSSAPSLQLVLLAGNFYERHGLTEQARQAYQRYAEVSPGSSLLEPAGERLAAGTRPPPLVGDVKTGWAEVLFTMASLLSQEQAADLSLIHSHLALRLNPKLDVARLLQGEILAEQERSDAAIAVFRQVDPASPLAWNARLRIADELNRMERTEEAIAELESLAAERPKDFEPLYRVGNLLRNQQQFDESVDAYDRAFERVGTPEQQHWSMHYFRGIALERSGQWERAEKDGPGAGAGAALRDELPGLFLGRKTAPPGPGQEHAGPRRPAASRRRLHRGQLGMGLLPPEGVRQRGDPSGAGRGAPVPGPGDQRPPGRRLLAGRAPAGGALPVAPGPQPRARRGPDPGHRGQDQARLDRRAEKDLNHAGGGGGPCGRRQPLRLGQGQSLSPRHRPAAGRLSRAR
jgi:tetratricopeptide (TPR) repeat protein